MKLYGAMASPYVARVVMFARLKDVELPLARMPGDSPRTDEYRAVNPIGKVPSLDLGDRIIPESEVICEYLEDAYPDKSGLPAAAGERATSRLIARITDLYISPNFGPFVGQLNPATRDQAIVDNAAAELAKAFGFLEYFMGVGPFCVGPVPSLGDCALGPYMMLLKLFVFASFDTVADPTANDGRLATWWQAMQDHDVCKATVDEYGAAVDSFMKAMGSQITEHRG